MRNGIAISVVVLAGCGGGSDWEGVWFVERPVLDASACEQVVGENYRNAAAPDLTGETGDWTITDESTMSAEAFFVQVLSGKDGDVFVVVGDEVYPGVADKNMLSVQWTGQIDDHYAEAHADGYFFGVDTTGTVDEMLMLMRDAEGGGVYGTWQATSSTTTSYAETDEWPMIRTGVSYTQVPSWSWLVGEAPDNFPDTRECEAAECALAITVECDGAVDVTARYAGTDGDGMFDGVEDAGQGAGTGADGGGGYTYVY